MQEINQIILDWRGGLIKNCPRVTHSGDKIFQEWDTWLIMDEVKAVLKSLKKWSVLDCLYVGKEGWQ